MRAVFFRHNKASAHWIHSSRVACTKSAHAQARQNPSRDRGTEGSVNENLPLNEKLVALFAVERGRVSFLQG